MLLLGGALATLAAAARPSEPSAWDHCILPPTRHLNFSDPCTAHSDVSSASISWAAQRGEYESAQLLLSASSSALLAGAGPSSAAAVGGELSVEFSDLVSASGSIISSSHLTWRQQGYVLVRHTSRYADSGCPGMNKEGSCWRPDPLLDPAPNNTIAMPTDPAHSQPIWITVAVPRNATPAPQHAEYTGQCTLSLDGATFASVNISLEVWEVAVRTPAEASVQHVWGFSSEHVLPFYPDAPAEQVQKQWWAFMEGPPPPPLLVYLNFLAWKLMLCQDRLGRNATKIHTRGRFTQAHRLPPMDTPAWRPPANASGTPPFQPFLSGKTAVLESGLSDHGAENESFCAL
jgi:hypothetical protein